MKKETRLKIEAWIFECMDFTGYDKEPEMNADKALALYDIFMAEKGSWHIPQVGRFKALVDWLQGLPSALHIPFNYVDIIATAKELGTIPLDASDKKLDAVCEKWFPWLAMRILNIWKQHGLTA